MYDNICKITYNQFYLKCIFNDDASNILKNSKRQWGDELNTLSEINHGG